MLNSKSSLFPNGIANSTGLVGKYIMDTVGSSVSGYLPILEDLPPANDDGVGGMHMYMPWWLYQEQKAGKMPFSRGYHVELGGGRGMPGAGSSEARTTSWAADTARTSSATSARSTAPTCISPAAAR